MEKLYHFLVTAIESGVLHTPEQFLRYMPKIAEDCELVSNHKVFFEINPSRHSPTILLSFNKMRVHQQVVNTATIELLNEEATLIEEHHYEKTLRT
jgi:hypothetical protein